MLRASLQAVFVLAAGVLLYWLWRRYVAGSRLRWIVALGFAGRAIAGQLLFWISWARLPFARGLQEGNGLWAFALDAKSYLAWAGRVAHEGPLAVVLYQRPLPAPRYVQTLAAFMFFFGDVATVGLLLNLFAYLGVAIFILRWDARAMRREGERWSPATLALLAVSFSPSAVLWSFQPLKDTFMQFAMVAFFASALLWERAWMAIGRDGAIVSAAAAMVGAMFLASGVRWYVGFVGLAAGLLFFLLIGLSIRTSKLKYGAMTFVVLFSLSQAFRIGGYTDVPWVLSRVANPAGIATTVSRLPQFLFGYVGTVRGNFARAGGATVIHAPKTDGAAPAHSANVTASVAAVFVPSAVAMRMGLLDIGGGRGLLWVTDIDTFLFDACLVAAIVLIVRRWRADALRNPLFWLVTLTTLLLSVPLAYAIVNFGTLFRLRVMMLTGVVLVPLALVTRASQPGGGGSVE
ncbi:MAG: hypothetical protein M3Q69_04975 [Acidobacteriota bacterium]|nr:hypothetical protein [Acidobacteriota bacterium]